MDIKILQLHKRASFQYKFIQDKFAFNELKNCFAVADGTTQSFNSEIWAEIITKQFALSPENDIQKLITDFTSYVKYYQNTEVVFSSNPAKASLERAKQKMGGTATFIGLHFLSNNEFNVISCGDTNLFLISNEKVDSFPYSTIDTLDANKYFINTEQLLQNKIELNHFQSKSFSFQLNDVIILATDALSRLLLLEPNIISELDSISEFEQLYDFCIKYWDKKKLEEDDITAIIIKIGNTDSVNYITPSEKFSFPKEIEPEFIPTTLPEISNQNNLTKMDMQEIKQQFNGVANDFHQLKKKLKFLEMLLMIAISIGLINLVCLFYFRSAPVNPQMEIQPQNSQNIIDSLKQPIEQIDSKLETTKIEMDANSIHSNTKSKDLNTEEITKRQETLKKAGYTVTVDGKWGNKSEAFWQDYLLKVKPDQKK